LQGYKRRAKWVAERCQFGYRNLSGDFAIGIKTGSVLMVDTSWRVHRDALAGDGGGLSLSFPTYRGRASLLCLPSWRGCDATVVDLGAFCTKNESYL